MEFCVKKLEDLSPLELWEIFKLRVAVFVVEQNCPYQEVDDFDKEALHLCLREKGEILAYARILPPGLTFENVSIGRVIAVKRRMGLGSKIVEKAILLAKEKFSANKIEIEAQVYAKEMYEKLGFKVVSDEFLEDGIPHVKMIYEEDN